MQKQVRKGRWLRRLLRTLVVTIGIIIIACLVFDHYYQFRRSDEEMNKIFTEQKIDAHIYYYTTHGRKLRYVAAGNDTLPTILFLHGSPGSISYYSRRFRDDSLRDRFHFYAVDRPGYGYSGFGDPEPSIQKQSEMIRPILDSLHHARHPVIIVGSSYGASIACRIAMDHPELVDGLVLTGPAIAPGRETYFGITPVIEHWSLRWFIPRIIRSPNTEKVHHKKELEKMLPYWKNIRVPVYYLQGANDDIVDTSNAGFAREQLVNVPSLEIKFLPNRAHRLAQFEWGGDQERDIECL
ncbi:MAG TPA: alpha/beta hydrolase [Chitinophagaceae bacterium]|jgi:pimeloyl-ACP methyl ester carboxylesterase|nr:alpha/beta hydrolase [Chitinophagaceae bacterium]